MDETIVEPADAPEKPRCVQIKATLASKINLADIQNAIPVVHELSLVNETADDINELQLAVIAVPSSLNPKTRYIDLKLATSTGKWLEILE